mgnify:CR=1 FL=1
MSAKSVVYAALTATGIPGRQDAYPVNRAPTPPFFVYTVESDGGFIADGIVYASLPRFHVELFEKVSDPNTEALIRDAILSIGQVVPHEVVGMANYGKNIFVGCGGSSMINSSHMLGAFYGMERIMGRDFSPVRKVFDYALEMEIPNTTDTQAFDLYINGEYQGLYQMTEKMEVGENRLEVPDLEKLNEAANPGKKLSDFPLYATENAKGVSLPVTPV